MSDKAVIFVGSHREGGNSQDSAEAVGQGIVERGGSYDILAVREFEIKPCIACGACTKDPESRCVFGRVDHAERLFSALIESRAVAFISPIYFYHLPALFKLWIDRSQRFWEARRKGEGVDGACSVAALAMHSGRPSGERLFDGSVLTMKYFLKNFAIDLAEPLVIRGVDAPDDLASRPEDLDALRELGRACWEGRLPRK